MKIPAWLQSLFASAPLALKALKRRRALARRDRWYRRRCSVRLRPKRIAGWWAPTRTAVRPARPDPAPLARAWRIDRVEAKRALVREAKARGRLLRRSARRFVAFVNS